MKHIRLTFSEYDKMLDVCQHIKWDTDNSSDVKFQFSFEDNIPTIKDFEDHDVKDHIEEYLPFLLYYSECYEPKEFNKKEFASSRGYIRRLLYDAVVLIDEDDLTVLENMTAEKWKKKKGSDKTKILSPIVSYYDADEENEFIAEMSKYPFFFWRGKERGEEELKFIFENIKEEE